MWYGLPCSVWQPAYVAELLPDRMADLRAIVDYGLLNPKQLSNQNR